MKLSLARLCLIAFILLELLLSAATLFLYRNEAEHMRSHPQSSESAASTARTRILELTDSLRRTAVQIASHPQTLRSLASQSENERLDQLANIRAFFPDAEVRLLPASSHAAAYSDITPLSAIHVRLLEEAGKNPEGGTTAARLTLTTIQPVFDNSKTIQGYVVLDRDLPWLQHTLKTAVPDDAYMELQQAGPDGTYSILAQHGNESRKAGAPREIIELPNTAWRLATWPAPATAASLGQNYLLGWLAASLIAAACSALLYFLLRRVLREDLQAILTLFDDIRHNRLRKSYDIQLGDITPTFDLMYRLGKLMVGKQKEVATQVSLDHLSQVHNRRSFEAKQQELFKSLSQGWVHSLLILDIDNFKQVNDTFGHDAGDTLIVQFGKILKDNLRASDFIARLGGDEFCVIFPNTPLKRAAELADRLRSNMPRQIELANGAILHRLSWSGGLSEYNRHDTSENMALSRADAALLEAKRAGRNRTSLKAAA